MGADASALRRDCLPPVGSAGPRIVTDAGGVEQLVAELSAAPRLALDLEASGMFAYRARPCALQLAGGGQVVVIDVLAAPIAPLVALLGPHGPVKIVHDLAFDARLLAEQGVVLGNVHDTAVAARMLGRTATGLGTLLETELGVRIDKSLQQHDWRQRPLTPAALAYLAQDVAHLDRLERSLWAQVVQVGIEDAVLEETRYRLACAVASVSGPPAPPPYVRVKGANKLDDRERAALRACADLREREARRRDVPAYKVASNEALVAIARARPSTTAEIGKLGVPTSTAAARAFADELARTLAGAPDQLPPDERGYFEVVRVPLADLKARREREARATAWRRAEAKRRGVDEQVVLPGHCLRDAVQARVATVDELSRIAGIGAFRVLRDGEAIVRALRGEEPGA